jgi:hypothetical protein
MIDQNPYLIELREIKKYNPNYGDDRVCECGHTYYRHFDTYEDMEPRGCKYCVCLEFIESKECPCCKGEGTYYFEGDAHKSGGFVPCYYKTATHYCYNGKLAKYE